MCHWLVVVVVVLVFLEPLYLNVKFFCFADIGVAKIIVWLFDLDSRNLPGFLHNGYWFWREDQIDHLQDHFDLNGKDF